MRLTGNYLIGPNGFFKHDGYNPVRNSYSIHWYPGYGLTVDRMVDGVKSHKVRFRKLAVLILKIKLWLAA